MTSLFCDLASQLTITRFGLSEISCVQTGSEACVSLVDKYQVIKWVIRGRCHSSEISCVQTGSEACVSLVDKYPVIKWVRRGRCHSHIKVGEYYHCLHLALSTGRWRVCKTDLQASVF
jgi:hypothetical protein